MLKEWLMYYIAAHLQRARPSLRAAFADRVLPEHLTVECLSVIGPALGETTVTFKATATPQAQPRRQCDEL